MRRRLLPLIAIFLGVCFFAASRLKTDPRRESPLLRGVAVESPATQQHRRTTRKDQGHRDSFYARTPRVVAMTGRPGRNDECQIFVDHTGNAFNMFSTGTTSILKINESVSGLIVDGGYQYYTICIAQHQHHHRVDIGLEVKTGEADLYLSIADPHPRVDKGSMWIAATAGDEYVSLPTYAEEFLSRKPNAIFVGVHGRPNGLYALQVAITDVEEREVSAHSILNTPRPRYYAVL